MRYANRVLAALLSLALAIAGVLLIIEVVADRAISHAAIVTWNSAYEWAGRTTWNAGSIRVTSAILIVAGLVLLAAELKPARTSRLPADPDQAAAAGIDAAYTRRSVAAAIRQAVTATDGIRAASVKVRPRKITITATATAADRTVAPKLREPVRMAARQRLDTLNLHKPPAVAARVTPGSR